MLLSLAACGAEKSGNDSNDETNAAEVNVGGNEVTTAAEGENEYTDTDSSEENANAPKINLDKLKEIEAEDTFEVKVTNKEIVKNAVSGFSMDGNDAISVTFENGSDKTITAVSLLVAAHNENEELVKLSLSYTLGDNGLVSQYSSDELELAPGDSDTMGIKCNAEKISGARIIVYSYTTSDGETVENPIAMEWYKNVEFGKTTVLD